MVKADGCVAVHADGGAYKPLNWMNAPNTLLETEHRWEVANAKGERLIIGLQEVISDHQVALGADPGLQKDGVESHLQELLADKPWVLEEGMVLLRREYPTDLGPVDLMCTDINGTLVADRGQAKGRDRRGGAAGPLRRMADPGRAPRPRQGHVGGPVDHAASKDPRSDSQHRDTGGRLRRPPGSGVDERSGCSDPGHVRHRPLSTRRSRRTPATACAWRPTPVAGFTWSNPSASPSTTRSCAGPVWTIGIERWFRFIPTSRPGAHQPGPARVFALSSSGPTRYSDVHFEPGDKLLFGPESVGLPVDDPDRPPGSPTCLTSRCSPGCAASIWPTPCRS